MDSAQNSAVPTGMTMEFPQQITPQTANVPTPDDDNDLSPSSHFSNCSSSNTSTPSSAPQYSEDIRRNAAALPALPLLPRHGSATSSSTKTCEVDLGDDERDTFSPVSSSSSRSEVGLPATGITVDAIVNTVRSGSISGCGLPDASCNNASSSTSSGIMVDNKAYDCSIMSAASNKHKALINGHASTSKEEKQRQNEEIVIMETSSISSETGSWESVFPQATGKPPHTHPALAAATASSKALPPPTTIPPNAIVCQAELHNCCHEFLQNERKCSGSTGDGGGVSKLSGYYVELSKKEELDKPKDNAENSKYAEDCQLYSIKDLDIAPFLRERTYSNGAGVTGDTSSLFRCNNNSTTSLLRDIKQETAMNTSGTSACFIDASSLRDEDELLEFPSLDAHNSTENVAGSTDAVGIVKDAASTALPASASEILDEESPTKQLESFHKSFAKCKTKSKELSNEDIQQQTVMFPPMHKNTRSTSLSSSSNSDIESPKKALSAASATSTNNLSDEEKLWKRENSSTVPAHANFDTKPHDPHTDTQQHEDTTEASVSLAIDADSSESSYVSKVQRIPERKHDQFSMQHNVIHFSVHPLGVSPKFAAHCAAASLTNLPATQHSSVAHSDLSYTTDYSSSSPGPSLVWSEHEQRPIDNVDGGGVGGLGLGSGVGNGIHSHRNTHSHLPDTPHNSIVHLDPVSSNNSSIHRDCTLSSSLSHQRDSGAYCSDATESPILIPRTPKRSKFDEANPIVSGGASIKDFNIKQCESPPVKRRTENCPIVSGGFVSLDFEETRPLDDEDSEEKVELRAKPKTRKPIPGIASWVVDMSDCRPERRKSTSSSSSLEASGGRFQRERSDSTSSHKSGCGFYVTLDDMDQKPKKQQMSKSYTAPKSNSPLVGMSHSDYDTKEDSTQATESSGEPSEPTDKKNIFSMFIDIGEKKVVRPFPRKDSFGLAQRNTAEGSPSNNLQRRNDDVMKSSASSTETLMWKSVRGGLGDSDEHNGYSGGESKSLDYRCNNDAPMTVAAVRRISQQQRAQNVQNESTKRHSWGNQAAPKDGTTHDYKRSISLSGNSNNGVGGDSKDNAGNNGLMSIIDKLPLISKASSLSVDSSLSPYDEYTGSKSGRSSSNNSARNSMSGAEARDDEIITTAATSGTRMKKRRRDVQINETFDKSSLASITDGVLSKDLSPASTTDTDDLTFQQDEEMAQREALLLQQTQPAQTLQLSSSNRTSAIIMETIIETKETSSPKKNAAGHTLETLHATIEKQQKMLLETVNENTEQQNVEKSSFVKLSDMDKPVKYDINSPESMSKSVGNHRHLNRLFRDERDKTRPHSWNMTRSTGNSFLNITNSVDNLRSLSRLFPNFSKEFSNSVPNDMVLDHQGEYLQTDLSGDSSLASSFSRSGMDESSISCRQPRRLGEDLLKMFLQEIATDMIVEVHGRRIKAHKCILRSRCQYFAAMLAGTNSQSVVSLQGYSYSTVHFALCHIYSGASHPPEGISLMELAALADLLGLEGLKEVTSHALKTNYCHNFHKPCSGCIDGILQVLPVALNQGLDDLYRKCLRWTCRHYLKVWPTRQFAQLPPDILGRCRQQIVAYLTSESVLDTVLDCDTLLAQLSSYRWGDICENLVRDILDASYGYIADHFASLIASDSFLSLGHARSCHIPRLESVLLRTAANLTPDQACRSYQRITRLNTVLQAKIIQMPTNLGELAKELQGLQEEELDWDAEYIRLVSALLSAIEQCLIRQCSRAMRVTAWQRMDLDLRKKIQTLARLTEPLDVKRNNGKPVGKAFSFGGSTRNQDLYQVKLAIQAHSKRAQDVQVYKATQTQDYGHVQTAERGVQANQDFKECTSKILKSNSKAHVPFATHRDASMSAISASSERHSINVTAHRRTQSEVPLPTQANRAQQQKTAAELQKAAAAAAEASKSKAVAGQKLGEIRSRYLEPRKAARSSLNNGPIRSATTSGIPSCANGSNKTLKVKQISSSDSSRNSSPAARKPLNNPHKLDVKASNISLDSLASPSRRCRSATRHIKANANDGRNSDANNDSIAESMRSSITTNKTISQESLASGAHKLTRSNPQMTTGVQAKRSLSNGLATSAGKNEIKLAKTKSIGSKVHRQVQYSSKISNGSSPSSVNTNKSATSRLSSVSSTHSTRDAYKQRSISVPAAQDAQAGGQGTQRYSFLSAKSREILAKRAEKNKQQQIKQQMQTGEKTVNESGFKQHHQAAVQSSYPLTKFGPQRSASHSAVPTIAQLHQQQQLQQRSIPPPSNIPTRRPNTLNLKNRTSTGSTQFNSNKSATATNNAHQIANNNQKNKYGNTGNNQRNAFISRVHQKIDYISDNESQQKQQEQNGGLHNEADLESIGGRVESKLERSSTFCKDSTDLDMNELQIIE